MSALYQEDLSAVGTGREVLTPATLLPQRGDVANAMLAKIAASCAGGLILPPWDYCALTYVGSTNNVLTAVYKTGGSGGTTVATLSFTYVGSGAADDDEIATITKA